MRLSLQSDYALRTLMFLALRQDQLTTISEVAKRYSISRNHLTKVAHLLGQEGFIKTVRGRAGGLRLSRAPDDINLGKVLRAFENDHSFVECFRETGQCFITPACRLNVVFTNALEGFYGVLDGYTLAALITDNAPLKTLFELETST